MSGQGRRGHWRHFTKADEGCAGDGNVRQCALSHCWHSSRWRVARTRKTNRGRQVRTAANTLVWIWSEKRLVTNVCYSELAISNARDRLNCCHRSSAVELSVESVWQSAIKWHCADWRLQCFLSFARLEVVWESSGVTLAFLVVLCRHDRMTHYCWHCLLSVSLDDD